MFIVSLLLICFFLFSLLESFNEISFCRKEAEQFFCPNSLTRVGQIVYSVMKKFGICGDTRNSSKWIYNTFCTITFDVKNY